MHPLAQATSLLIHNPPPPGAEDGSGNTWIVYVVVAFGLILINAFFAAAETSLLSVRDTRISQLIEEGVKNAKAVQRLRQHPERLLVSIQIMVTLVTTLASALATEVAVGSLSNLPPSLRIAISTIVVVFFLSLFGEIAPKNWAVSHPERFALLAARTVEWSSRFVLFPMVWTLENLAGMIIRLFGGKKPTQTPYITEQEIKIIVEEGAKSGELEHHEKEMIHGVMEIPGRTSREIMTPRTQIVGIEINAPISHAVELVVEEGHTRLPVYRNTIDDIVGVLHAKDILKVLGDGGSDATIEQLMMKPLQIPEAKKVDKLLQDFQAYKTQMAIVLDEYGGTAGVVTMEDVLEEIVGPIMDEYDEPEEREIQMLEPGIYRVAGTTNVDDVVELLNLELNEDDVEGTDTIGGLVFTILGRVPQPEDCVHYGGWKMTVEDVARKAVHHLRMERSVSEIDPEDPPPSPVATGEVADSQAPSHATR